jgi:segregation and condensation protein A
VDGATLNPAAGDPVWDDWEGPLRASAASSLGAGSPAAGSPAALLLHLEGFDGPLDLLLDLAERQRIDFGRMSILALAEQFAAALARFGDEVPIERRADWLVMATRLLLLRSRLLFPESPAAAAVAERDAASELRRIDELAAMRAAAAWLGARPALGHEIFTRGAPERQGVHLDTAYEADVIAFLWASLTLFEDGTDEPDTVARYRPLWADLHSAREAQTRILRMLGEGGDGEELRHFLPQTSAAAEAAEAEGPALRLTSAWATTFSASLELAKQGDVDLLQAKAFRSIHLSRATARPGP